MRKNKKAEKTFIQLLDTVVDKSLILFFSYMKIDNGVKLDTQDEMILRSYSQYLKDNLETLIRMEENEKTV